MNEEILKLFKKYRHSGVLVDTNILLLFIVGSLNPELISRHSRTACFTFADFQIISKAIDFFEKKVSTPHILTEVSNLIGRDKHFRRALGSYIETATEKFASAAGFVSKDFFLKFGVADAATCEISKNEYMVITDDGSLYGFLINNGIDAVNLTTLRRLIS